MASLPSPKGDALLLLRGLPALIELGLLIFCLIEAIQTPSDEMRNLPKVAWIILILFVPVIGGIAWLVAGRPTTRRRPGWRSGSGFPEYERPYGGRSVAPDDDPAFLAQLRSSNDEHEQALRTWEADLRRREEQLRRDAEPKDDAS
jgi:hypothetical protein